MVLRKLKSEEWANPQILGDYLFECIEYLEHIGMYATVEGEPELRTCMDYLLEKMSAHGKKRMTNRVYVAVRNDSYNGSNMELRSRLHHRLYVDFPYAVNKNPNGVIMEFASAVAEFYINNPVANPESPHCGVIIDDPDKGWMTTPVNCLTKIVEMGKNNLANDYGREFHKYYITDPFLNVVNGGNRCGLFKGTTYNNVDIYEKTSCLEVVMNREIDRADYGVISLYPDGFGYNIDRYDMSLDCIDNTNPKQTMPCIQKLVQTYHPSKYTNYIQSFANTGIDAEERLNTVLLKKYKFKKIDKEDLPESTAIDYIINNRNCTNLWTLLQTGAAVPLLTHGSSCVSRDGATPIPCFSKLLMNVRDEDEYYIDDMDQKEMVCQSMDNPRFSRAVLDETCYDGDTPLPCLSTLIDIVSKQDQLKNIFLNIMETSPLTDFICAEKRGDEFKTVNCLDKSIGCSTSHIMDLIGRSGMLLDRRDCTDWNGDSITCIDKLFQRHEMWVHNYFRARELSRLNYYFTAGGGKSDTGGGEKTYNDSNELAGISNKYNLNDDPGFRSIALEYDFGALKAHSPSKTFEEFKHVIESQLEDYRADPHKTPLHPTTEEVRYAQELLRSITSEKPSKEVQIVPKVYKMLDVYTPLFAEGADYSKVGVGSMLKSEEREVPLTLNMFECRDAVSGKTISCLQKQIDVVDQRTRGAYKNLLYVGSVMAYKDLFKPEMCVQLDTGQKMTCMEYAYNKLHENFDRSSYITLISRKDFNKIANVEINTDRGKIKLINDVCSQVSLREISRHLKETKVAHTVTNGNPTFDGTALSLYERCECASRKTPLDRRICLDAACLSTYVEEDEDGYHWSDGYIGYDEVVTEDGVRDAMFPQIYHDSQDYFGLSGVYELTYQPSAYRITSTERFDYDHAVKDVLFPAIKRAQGMKLARLGDKKNIKIDQITLHSPTSKNDDYIIEVLFAELDKITPEGYEGWVERYSAATIFLRGGLLNRDDIRMKAIRYKNESDTAEKILTIGSKDATSISKIKLIISNRPADYMRASTCQDWSSCITLNDGQYNYCLPFWMGTGGYIAYLASDEFAPSWYARSIMMPIMRYKEGDKKTPPFPAESSDPNNSFRVNSVYGLSMYKPLLKDAIQVILREHGYNEEDSFRTTGDSGDFIASSHNIKKLKEDVWMNNRKEAYRNCLERVLKGEVVSLPKTQIAKTEEDCKSLTKVLSVGGFRIEDIYEHGLISDRSFNRFKTIPKWDTSYLDSATVPYEILDFELRNIKKNVSAQYLKPITIPGEM